jgi:hypothetical protein
MAGDEGYLSHTLPVRPWQHIVCKLVTSSCWTLLSTALVTLSVLYMAVDLKNLDALGKQAWTILDEVALVLNLRGSTLLWGLFVFIVAAAIEKTLAIYAGMGIGQISAKRKTGMSILAVLGLYTVEQLLGAFVLYWIAPTENGLSIFAGGNGALIVRFLFWWYIGWSALCGAIYAFVCNWMLKRHLNLA